jgi:hypothetical protein
MGRKPAWTMVWYATVLAAALGWGYAGPGYTDAVEEVAAVQASDTDAGRLELRRLTQQMLMR